LIDFKNEELDEACTSTISTVHWGEDANLTGICVYPDECTFSLKFCPEKLNRCGFEGKKAIVCCPAEDFVIKRWQQRKAEKS